MALVGGIVVAVVVLLSGWIHPPGAGASEWVGSGGGPSPAVQVDVAAVRASPGTEFTRALYTAVLAPIVLGLLQRIKRAFAFEPQRRKLVNRT
jgi:hypothetical protein